MHFTYYISNVMRVQEQTSHPSSMLIGSEHYQSTDEQIYYVLSLDCLHAGFSLSFGNIPLLPQLKLKSNLM